jgi:hypothetical protein
MRLLLSNLFANRLDQSSWTLQKVCFQVIIKRPKITLIGLILCGLPFPIAAQTPIPLQPVQPSLWWAVERFGQNLVEDLRLDPANQTVEIEVNEGVWSTWDYLKRYALIEQLGRVAIAENFGIQILDGRKNILVEYLQIDGYWQAQPLLLGANPYRFSPSSNRIFVPRR